MKRKKQFLIIIIALLFMNVSYSQITFQKEYGGTVIDFARSINQTSDSGFIICGYSRSYGAGYADVYLIKTNVNGDTLWTRTYGNTGYEDGTSVKQTFDDGYIVLGGAANVGALYLIKTDLNGDTLWTKTIKDSLGNSWGNDVQQTTDSGYVITGESSVIAGSISHVYLVKTNSYGDILWTKIFGGLYYQDLGRSVKQTSDGGYIITGFTFNFNSSGGTQSDIYLIKTNSFGDTIWTKTYGGNANEEGFSIVQTFDSGYIITGYTSEYPGKLFLLKTNTIGDTLWTKLFSSAAYIEGFSIQQTSDSGFVIAGVIENVTANKPYALLIKTDINGDTLWTRTFGLTNISSSGEEARSVQQLADGSYIIVGAATTLPGPDAHIYLIKADVNGHSTCNEYFLPIGISTFSIQVGSPATNIFATHTIIPSFTTIINRGCTITDLCSGVGINEITAENRINIYPNPTKNNFTISINGHSSMMNGQISIYNVMGEKIFEETIFNLSSKEIYLKNISRGIYFVKVFDGENQYGKKLIVEHD